VRAIFLAAAAGVTLFSLATPAAANGRFPASNQIVFSPTDANLVVLRTSYGVLPSHDDGASWGYICEDALGLGPTAVEDPSIGLTQHNTLIAGVSVGLDVSSDVGCNWNCIGGGLAGQAVADIAIRPDDPTRAVALTRTYVPTDSAVEMISSQVFETTDEGATWSPMGTPIDPTVTVATVDVTKTDPNRIYVSGTRNFGTAKTASLFVSTDKGATWTEEMLPSAQFDPSMEDSIYIGAVDPTDADRVYIRSEGILTGGESRLTVFTRTPGASAQFKTAYLFDVGAQMGLTGELLGFALSEDGSKIYVGSQESGLWVGTAADLMFHKTSSIIVQCLATHGNELWACSAAVSGFVAGVSTDDGATFTAKLPLIGALTGPIACPANPQGAACGTTTNSSQCVAAYATFCTNEICGPADAGATSPPAKASSSSCDVAVVGGGGATVFGAIVAMAGLSLRRRRRDRSTRRSVQ
jgi:hypothetical protein